MISVKITEKNWERILKLKKWFTGNNHIINGRIYVCVVFKGCLPFVGSNMSESSLGKSSTRRKPQQRFQLNSHRITLKCMIYILKCSLYYVIWSCSSHLNILVCKINIIFKKLNYWDWHPMKWHVNVIPIACMAPNF